MKALIGALAVTTVFATAPAAAAGVDYLLEIEGIKGESKSTVKASAIDLQSWSWGLSLTSSIGGVGKVSLQDFHWTQYVDSTAPQLLGWFGSNNLDRDVTLTATRTDAKAGDFSFFEIAFGDSSPSSFLLGGSAGAGTEGLMVQASVLVTSATMSYRTSPTAAWTTGRFSVADDRLLFSGDPIVLQGYALAVAGVVPEPSTWALMLGGLALTGCAALRRRRG
ncbi:type VI secretion system tube protein Hcp [Roseateles sp. LYH14W]|uniref:Type VI secretion system tube protein Hcp n=1 Tax=Pelomonas parva TaxID=3299032 RepID=A0ABW7F5P8_9BURK